VLRALLSRCWNGGRHGVLFWKASSKKECLSMRIHIDKNQFDGNAIALVVIGLLIVIALAY
jgi:hypothetical protein